MLKLSIKPNVTLSAESSLILEENKTAFHREGHKCKVTIIMCCRFTVTSMGNVSINVYCGITVDEIHVNLQFTFAVASLK